MKPIQRKFIDWKKTGRKLQMLREDNKELRRFVCFALKHDKGNCDGKCDTCEYDMDNHISRSELGRVFGQTESVIYNWEIGRTDVKYEDLLLYEQVAHVDLKDIIVFMSK